MMTLPDRRVKACFASDREGREKKKRKNTYQLESDKEDVVDHKRPLAAVAISGDAKDDGADRPEHQHQRDAPGDVRVGLAELLGEVGRGQRNGEEVKGIPRLSGISQDGSSTPR